MANRFLNNIRINDSYTLPSTDGTANQVITTDGAGNLSFIDVNSVIDTATGEVYYTVKNSTGSTLSKGKAVMAVGSDGNSGHILVNEMIADGSVEPKYFLGVLAENIGNGNTGKAIHFGQIGQFNTNGQNGETWSDGQVLWCDPDNPGDFTITEPDGPNLKIAAVIILNASTNGKMQVRVQANEGIHDLHDTKITSQVDGDVLVWNNTDGVWFNDSTLNVDYTNGRVGIGTDSPSEKLDVRDGTITSRDSGNVNYAELDRFAGLTLKGNGAGAKYISTPNTDDLGFKTNNAEKMRITSAGNVLIGTTTENGLDKLQVNGSSTFTSTINVGAPGISGPLFGNLTFKTLGNVDSEGFLFKDSNDLTVATIFRTGAATFASSVTASNLNISDSSSYSFGSGTTKIIGNSIANVLDIQTNNVSALFINATGAATFSSSVTASSLIKSGGTSSQYLMADGSVSTLTNPITGTGTTNYLSKFTGTSALGNSQIYDNGTNVGIGTTSPSYKLDVSDAARVDGVRLGRDFSITNRGTVRIDSNGDSPADVLFGRTAAANESGWTGVFWSLSSRNSAEGSSFKLYRGTAHASPYNSEAVPFLVNPDLSAIFSGNVGIGTTSPISGGGAAKWLTIDGTTTYGGGLISSINGIAKAYFYSEAGYAKVQGASGEGVKLDVNGGTSALTILSGGNVGIGTTSPGYTLDVNGGIRTILGYIRGANSSADINLDGNVGSRVRYGGQSVTLDSSNVGFRTSSTERMRINSAGNVGIGTTSPDQKLVVSGTTNIYSKVITSGVDSTLGINLVNDARSWVVRVDGADGDKFQIRDASADAQRLTIDTSGNVGIGTTSPAQNLEVKGSSSGVIRLSSTSYSYNIFTNESDGTFYIRDVNNTSNRLAITSTGNVGIGTSSPGYTLDVNGSLHSTNITIADGIYHEGDTNNYISFSTDTQVFATSGNERLRINSSGNVGIGTTSPNAKLDVNGDALISGVGFGAGGGGISSNTAAGSGALSSNMSGTFNTAIGRSALISNMNGTSNTATGISALQANTSGSSNVAVGSSSLRNADASFNTAIGAFAGEGLTSGNGNIIIGSLDRNGNYVPAYDITSEDDHISMGTTTTQRAYINVSWEVLSDARYKTEFNEIPHGLDFVKQLNPISYKLRKNKDTEETIGDKSYGFKAQDILALEGDDPVIINNRKEDRLTYKESNLIPILVKAIQDLSKEVELLKQQINN